MKQRIRYALMALGLSFVVLTATGCSAGRYLEIAATKLQSPAARYLAEGELLAAEGRTTEAILAYRQSLAHDSQNVTALRKLARAYADQGRARMAQRYLERAIALRPADAELAAEAAALTPPPPRLKLLWQTAVGEDVPTGIAVQNGVIYTALESGLAAALEADSGAVR